MELGDSNRRSRRWIVACLGAVALAAAAPTGAWADQANDNRAATSAGLGAQPAAACPANVNRLGDQVGSASCGPGAQSNSGADSGQVVTAGFKDTGGPPPPGTSTLALGGSPGRFPALGLVVLAVLAAAAVALRRLQQER